MNNEEKNQPEPPLKCEDIQAVLFDYMTRELGEGRSDLVREHMRKCEKCQAAAAEIQATLDVMNVASKADSSVPSQLSDARRARIIRAIVHPVLDWIYVYHMLVSILVTLLAIAAILLAVRRLKLWEKEDFSDAIPVTIGNGKPGGDRDRWRVTPRQQPPSTNAPNHVPEDSVQR